jgi:hypothetical protein
MLREGIPSGMTSADRPDDELYPAAFRLARLYALLSPRIIMQELKVDRTRAERLLELLAERGAVGTEPILRQTGARESKVNIVEDEAPRRPDDVIIGTDPGMGRRAIVLAAVALLLGLLFELALFRIGAGAAVARWLRAEIGSPIAAAVITNMVPLIGLGLGWLLEQPFRSNEELVPYFHLRLRAAAWNAAGILGVGYVIVSLLR